ncbi:MAG: 16S rRNA processing protein RimM [Chloroflexota bacterium]|nr:16S rRNA processing protein RimM [Chloroflexota bacterium]MDE3100806.1 16S rRNA processing protein RimM [Chloroflexota bacterium]
MAPRSTSRSTETDRRSADVVVGVVRAPHGIRGEVRVEPMTDRAAERFRVGSRLTTDRESLVVASVRGTSDAPIVAFEGVADRSAAERLRDRELRVPRAAARREGEYLWDDLVGLETWTVGGERLGEVREVLRAGGADVLVVRDGDREILLPMLESVVREVDLGGGRIVVAPQEEA